MATSFKPNKRIQDWICEESFAARSPPRGSTTSATIFEDVPTSSELERSTKLDMLIPIVDQINHTFIRGREVWDKYTLVFTSLLKLAIFLFLFN